VRYHVPKHGVHHHQTSRALRNYKVPKKSTVSKVFFLKIFPVPQVQYFPKKIFFVTQVHAMLESSK
jgi:hypothetical protein